MIRFRVWANVRPMGWFGHAASEYFFEYDPQWLAQPGGYVLAPQFALGAQRYTGTLVRGFFENLLPEGTALDDVIAALQQRIPSLRDPSPFELLGQLGKELPGVLSLLPDGVQPMPLQQYQALPYAVLSERIRSSHSLLLSNENSTMSLAGAQEKMGLRFDAQSKKSVARFSESVGTSLTTHILKPDTRQPRYQPSAINEYACMKLARALRLPVPDVWFVRVPEPVYVVQRYDRVNVAGNIVGLHQFDGCQLLGHGSGWKYERQGGLVSLPKLVAALRTLRVRGGDLLQLQRWVMFNYLLGNADAHAKNLSVLVDENGFRLAPFYDLMCVRAYGDTGLALYIGDEDTFDAVASHSWEAFCNDCGFRKPETMKELCKLARGFLPAWQKTREKIAGEVEPTPQEVALLDRMTKVFETHCGYALSMTDP